MERDTGYYEQFCTPYISTHTLTWSVTQIDYFVKNSFIISTHTLTWSVTPNNYTDKIDLNISTHTLTWSVTAHKNKIVQNP